MPLYPSGFTKLKELGAFFCYLAFFSQHCSFQNGGALSRATEEVGSR